MLKNLAALEHKIEDRTYQFICKGEATWGEIHDVLWKMKDFVVEQIKAIHQKQRPEEPKPIEEAKLQE
jgi:hypothetical protein